MYVDTPVCPAPVTLPVHPAHTHTLAGVHTHSHTLPRNTYTHTPNIYAHPPPTWSCCVMMGHGAVAGGGWVLGEWVDGVHERTRTAHCDVHHWVSGEGHSEWSYGGWRHPFGIGPTHNDPSHTLPTPSPPAPSFTPSPNNHTHPTPTTTRAPAHPIRTPSPTTSEPCH